MAYDNDALQELCSQIDLLEYASRSMEFKKVNNDSWSAHCTKHIDKTASLFITPTKQLFYCHSCHTGGNIINWLMEFECLNFNESVDKVANMVGKDIKNLKTCEALSYYKKIFRCLDCNNNKKNTVEREILPLDSINNFSTEIPTEWVEEGISETTIVKYEIRIDEKANRIVYPVYDNDLNLIGFKGRTRFKNYKEMRLQKYMNYNKIGTTDFFMGMKQNRESIIRNGKAIVFEGLKSVMKAVDYGYDYCLAAETSCLNEEQIKILIRLGVKDIFIGFDSDVEFNDIVGSKNIKKLKRFCNVYVIRDKQRLLGKKEDKMAPVDKGKAIFETLLEQAVKI